MKKIENKKCDICGRTIGKIKRNTKLDLFLCDKHSQQYRNYGKFLDNNPRTCNDLNEIVVDENNKDISYMGVYNKFGEKIYDVIIDSDDIEKIKDKKWRYNVKKGKPYILTGSGAGNQVYLSRFIMNYDGKMEIDHINGNVLDNRKSNLRIVERKNNIKNLKQKNNSIIGIRGVSFDSKHKEYVVDFSSEKNRFFLKPFKKIEEAVFCRYLLENMINKEYRYFGNDEKINEYISKLSYDNKKEIYDYVLNKIKLKGINYYEIKEFIS